MLALQLHPLPAVMLKLSEPEVAVGLTLAGLMEYEQGTPACVMVNVWPPAVIVPLRELVLVFAS